MQEFLQKRQAIAGQIIVVSRLPMSFFHRKFFVVDIELETKIRQRLFQLFAQRKIFFSGLVKGKLDATIITFQRALTLGDSRRPFPIKKPGQPTGQSLFRRRQFWKLGIAHSAERATDLSRQV